jgi:hypothetical protein
MKRTTITRHAASLPWIALCAALWPVDTMGQNGAPSTVAAVSTVGQTTGKIELDGVMDEPDWAQAPLLGDIRQREPKPGVAATERTEVRLLTDKNNLYF